MKMLIRILFVFTILLTLGLVCPAGTSAAVEVNIGIGIPLFSAPPELVVYPDTDVYVVPNYDVFFYRGLWYRPYRGRWYESDDYDGPWGFISRGRVPGPIIGLPPDFRQRVWYEHVPYGQVKKNWRGWERDRYWNGRIRGWHEGPGPWGREGEEGEQGEGHGHGHGHGRGHED